MSAETETSIHIGEIKKNAKEVVRLSLRSYKGSAFLDVRIWYMDSDGDLKPSSKGVTLRPSLIPELSAVLRSAEEQARARGLLSSLAPKEGVQPETSERLYEEDNITRLVDGLL
jgi:hypothetical protein